MLCYFNTVMMSELPRKSYFIEESYVSSRSKHLKQIKASYTLVLYLHDNINGTAFYTKPCLKYVLIHY